VRAHSLTTLRDLLALLPRTGLQVLKMPRAWTARQWTGRLGLIALIALAALEKRPLQAAIQGHARYGLVELAAFVDEHADGTSMFLYAFLVFALGWIFRVEKVRQASEVILSSGVFCFLFWVVGKFIFAERRPLDGGELLFFTQGGHGVSGHAAVAALLILPARAVLLRDRTRWVQNAGMAAAILWVAIVCWSRVYLGRHFVWNVLAGIAVGLFCSAAAIEALRDLKNRISPTLISSDRATQ
jgi:membrane-associated phospholipid phosphatase